jgi:predicted ATPase
LHAHLEKAQQGERQMVLINGEAGIGKSALLDAFVAQLADTVPLVLILEDLHGCDMATVDLLAWLARRRQPARLLLLATYQPVETIVRQHPLRSVSVELALHSGRGR